MAKGRVVLYEQPRTPARPVYTGRARRRRRRRGVRRLLFALAALVVASAVGYVLWYTHPARQSALEDPERSQVEGELTADGGSTGTAAAAVTGDGAIVVAIDPGHGGVNPNIGAEDYGSEANGLRESEVTLATARALYDLLAADDRFAPVLTADGSQYLKPSERGAAAQAAGAELLLSIHLNYDSGSSTSGFECYAAPPNLSTNADSVRFASCWRIPSARWGCGCGAPTACATYIMIRTTTSRLRIHRHYRPVGPHLHGAVLLRVPGGALRGRVHHQSLRHGPAVRRRGLPGGGPAVLRLHLRLLFPELRTTPARTLRAGAVFFVVLRAAAGYAGLLPGFSAGFVRPGDKGTVSH